VRRRDFITLLGGTAAAWPVVVYWSARGGRIFPQTVHFPRGLVSARRAKGIATSLLAI